MNSKSKVVVRYAETDKMGIVHHSVYPIWYEIARTDFIKLSGISYSKMEEIGIMTPLLELQCKYLKPSFYEDELTIEVSIENLTPVKIVFNYKVYRDDILLNTGKTMHAFVDKEMKPINIKKKFAEIYEKLANMDNR